MLTELLAQVTTLIMDDDYAEARLRLRVLQVVLIMLIVLTVDCLTAQIVGYGTLACNVLGTTTATGIGPGELFRWFLSGTALMLAGVIAIERRLTGR